MTHIGGLHDTVTGSVILIAKEVKEVEDHIDQLEAENAKLRELVKHINTCNTYTAIECANVHCWECPYDNSTGNCDFDKRMHELGIEVVE